jgi:hypothetical protein
MDVGRIEVATKYGSLHPFRSTWTVLLRDLFDFNELGPWMTIYLTNLEQSTDA